MDDKQIKQTLQIAIENSKKRNFSQSVDLIINLKSIDLKKPDENINTFLTLPHPRGKESKIAAIVGKELITKAKAVTDTIISQDEFPYYQEHQKILKKRAKNIDFFIAQANLMPDIAKYFGKILGPIGKMPNPKAGAVVPPTIPELKSIVGKLKNTIKIQTKNEPVIKCSVGIETMEKDAMVENIKTVYNTVLHSVKDESHNIKNTIIKLSMGRPFIIGKSYTEKELHEGQKEATEKKPKKQKTKIEPATDKAKEEKPK